MGELLDSLLDENFEYELESFDPKDCFVGMEDGYDELCDMIVEAATDPKANPNNNNQPAPSTKAGNIFTRLINFIKRAWAWICNTFNRIWKAITGVFKKKSKTPDQILDDMGVKPNSEARAGKINIPGAGKSTQKIAGEVEVMIKPMLAKINADDSITFTANTIGETIMDTKKQGPVPGQYKGFLAEAVGSQQAATILIMMTHPDCMQKVMHFLQMTLDVAKGARDASKSSKEFYDKYQAIVNAGSNAENAKSALEKFMQFLGLPSIAEIQRTSQLGITVTLKQIRDFQSSLNYMNDRIKNADVPAGINADKKDMEIVNLASNLLASIQMAMNALTQAVSNVYEVDATYTETINDVQKLGIFVKAMIDAAVPAKYISWNTYIVASKNLKGEGKKEDPIWGQSRVVLFPSTPGDVVYKVALSGWGIRANQAEEGIWKRIAKYQKDKELFAEVKAITKNGAIETMERVNTDHTATMDQIEEIKNRLRDIEKRLAIPLMLHQDIHTGNVGWRNGNPVCMDYGLVSRRDPNKPMTVTS